MSFENVLPANVYPTAGMVLLIGLVVVFAVLLVLTFVFWMFGKVMGNQKESVSPVAAPLSPKPSMTAPAPDTTGVPDEVVAVIAAAVAAMSDGTTHYTIRRIRPATTVNARPVWAAAGLAENTRPF